MHRRLLFTGAIQENIENKMAARFPHAQNKTKMVVVGRLTMPSAVLLIHSWFFCSHWGTGTGTSCSSFYVYGLFLPQKKKKEYAAAFSGEL